jgi:hypothetical protein
MLKVHECNFVAPLSKFLYVNIPNSYTGFGSHIGPMWHGGTIGTSSTFKQILTKKLLMMVDDFFDEVAAAHRGVEPAFCVVAHK